MAQRNIGDIGSVFRRTVHEMFDRQTRPEAIGARIQSYATDQVRAMIAGGNASPKYRLFVDGTEGKPVSQVALNGGTVLYLFSRLTDAVVAALAYARSISPVGETGNYRDSWVVIVNGNIWTGQLTDIPQGSEVTLTNFAPYARKIEEKGRFGRGGRLKSYPVPARVISEQTRRYVARLYPYLKVTRAFVLIPGGYILKTGPEAGQPMTYPAVIIAE
jgi:hypothetical protein